MKTLSQPRFNGRIRALMTKAQRYGDDLAYIGSIWKAYRPWNEEGITRETFDRHLMAGMTEGELVLSRADLVGAMDRDLVKDSEVRHWTGAEFHFVRISDTWARR